MLEEGSSSRSQSSLNISNENEQIKNEINRSLNEISEPKSVDDDDNKNNKEGTVSENGINVANVIESKDETREDKTPEDKTSRKEEERTNEDNLPDEEIRTEIENIDDNKN